MEVQYGLMRLPLLLLATALASACLAQGSRVVEGRRLTVPPVIDGTIDPAEWAEASVSNGFIERFTQRETRFTTTVYVGYDDEAAYFAFVAYDPEPHLIRATEYRREGNIRGDDRLTVNLNPYGTLRNEDFNEFRVNPRGATTSSFAGGRAAKREWQGEWEAEARITDTGWTAEFRIPWRILRLPGPGVRDLTINFERDVPRAFESTQWSSLGPDRRPERHGRWTDVELPLIELPSIVQALPYVVGGYEDGAVDRAVGADFRHQFGTQFTGLATINPDFRNIEQAVLGVEFSRFERLPDERRPFFTEGEDLYRFGGMSARMFAPQRIGEIDFGTKFFGKISDEQSIAFLVASRFGEDTAGVGRYRMTFGPDSSITAGYTFRNSDGIDNHGFGLDYRHQGRNWGAGLILGATNDGELGWGERINPDIFYRNGPLSVSVGWQRIAPSFLPRLGFAPRRGYQGPYVFTSYSMSWLNGPFSGVSIQAAAEDTTDLLTGGLFVRGNFVNGQVTMRNGVRFGGSVSNSNFRGQKDRLSTVFASYPVDDPFKGISIRYTTGSIGDLSYGDVQIGGQYRFPFRLSVLGGLQFVELGKERRTQHIVSLAYELSEFQSLLGRGVYRNGDLNWYLAFRQSGNLGVEYYLIVGDPNAERFTSRVALKMILPFDLALR